MKSNNLISSGNKKIANEIVNQILGLYMDLHRAAPLEARILVEESLFKFFKNLKELGGNNNKKTLGKIAVANKLYVCSNCKAECCKLWRTENIGDEMYCSLCTVAKSRYALVDLDDDGTILDANGNRTHMIGDYFPAIMMDLSDDNKIIWCSRERSLKTDSLTTWKILASSPLRESND